MAAEPGPRQPGVSVAPGSLLRGGQSPPSARPPCRTPSPGPGRGGHPSGSGSLAAALPEALRSARAGVRGRRLSVRRLLRDWGRTAPLGRRSEMPPLRRRPGAEGDGSRSARAGRLSPPRKRGTRRASPSPAACPKLRDRDPQQAA
ncbi:unnamed protein product [Natator depressus]